MGLHEVVRVVAIVAIAVGLLGGWIALDPLARERLVGDVPEARIQDYLSATARGDAEPALAVWQVRDLPQVAGLSARRDDITARLSSEHASFVRIDGIEWWRTCCEPGLVDGPRNAGLARATVTVRTGSGERRYIFDVLARSTTYWGDAAGDPPHEWTLRDVYLESDAPLFFRFPRQQG